MSRLTAAVLVVGLALPALPARADEPHRRRLDHPSRASYYLGGGALPFFFATGAAGALLPVLVDPPASPRLFSASEGGETPSDAHRVPAWAVGLGAGAFGAGLLVLSDDPVRWYHFKGYAESAMTTLFLTSVAKVTFGRHRPDYDLTPGADNPVDERRSFFSGHSSMTLGATTYFALYLRFHGLDRFRPHGSFAWWEPLPYAGLAALSFYVPWTRVVDHRHNLSDVLVGGAVGAATSTAFFAWQEHRWRRDSGAGDEESHMVVVPDIAGRGLQVVGSF